MATLKELISKEAARGVVWLQAEFSGSGDEGNLNCVHYSGKDGQEIIEPSYSRKLEEALEDLFSCECTCDWYNGDGGGGTLTVRTLDCTYDLTSYYNETNEVSNDNIEAVALP